MTLKKSAAIIGYAEMPPQKKPEGQTPLGIIGQMAAQATADAGLDPDAIDGLLTAAAFGEYCFLWPSAVGEYLGLQPRHIDSVELGGASGAGMVWRAAAAIQAGLCENVLCVIGDTWDLSAGMHVPMPALAMEYDAPYGLLAANPAYALITQRHMYEFGTTPEQLAEVAVFQRKNACKNPTALFGDTELTVDDVLSSRMICDPLHLFEIVRPCTGGAAFVVTSAQAAKKSPHRPVYLLGAGEAAGPASITQRDDITNSLIKPAADTAFKMAGVSRTDISFIQPYDCYSIMVLLTLEDAGFCEKGQAGRFVQEHDLTIDGDLPCNTHGGQLSFGQPGLAGGMSHVIEAVRQLMGRAGDRQIPEATLGYVNGNGGMMSEEVSLILGVDS